MHRAIAALRASGIRLHALCALLMSPAVVLGQTNLALNPSFELLSGSLPSNWSLCTSSGAATLGSATSPVDQGSRSLRVAVSQAGDVGVCSDAIAVSAGVTYRVAARLDVNISPTTNKQARLQIIELSSGDVQLSSKVVAVSVGRIAGWENLSGFFTTGSSAAKVKIRLLQDVPGSSNITFYWDTVSLARDTAVAGERWERELTSSNDYTQGTNSNPYRDMRLTATFYRNAACGSTPPAPSSCALPNCFQQAGFWDGVPGSSSAKTFKVRTTLPAGNWCWNTACSTVGASGATTPSCAGDSGLTQSGTLTVTGYGGANLLYKLGLPTAKKGAVTLSYLVYGDSAPTTFPWIADTAWSAPANFSLPALGTAPSTDLWKNYIADRASKGFTVVLVAPTPQYSVSVPVSQPTPPSSGFAGFRAMAGCTPANYKVVPNECSYLDPTYWQKLDSMVKDANDGLYKDANGVDKAAGIVVVVSGVIDPTDRGGPGTLLTPLQKYPRREAAEAFARQLAARLAGSYVFFSPGFDDKFSELLDDGVLTVQHSMTLVGPALHSAAPRHLIGNQLAGGEDITHYDTFHNTDWLSFEFYQSGHKGNQGLPCSYDAGQEYARAVCRARELTLRFRCQGAASTVKDCPGAQYMPASGNTALKPAVNSEGAYEDFSTTANDPDTREGERHTAYVSGLSGSFGYTIGVLGIRDWSNPGIYSNSYQSDKSQSDGDLGRLGGLFRGSPWTDLEPRHNLIANNPVVNTSSTYPATTGKDPANEKNRMVLATNTTYALIYVPGIPSGSTASVRISTGLTNSLSRLNCDTPTPCWTKKWVSPRPGESDQPATCTPGNGFITVGGTLGCPKGSLSCDWVLKLTKGTSASCNSANATAATTAAPTAKSELLLNDLEVWTELSEDSLTSAVLAQAFDSDGIEVADPFVVSPDGTSFQKLPTAAVDSVGNFFVTWEAQSPDTGLDEIWARRYDNYGEPLSDPFLVSPPAEGQQAEPSVAADSSDNVTVSWTRHDQVDDDGEITLQTYDGTGSPVADPVSLPPTLDGAVTMSLVQADGQVGLWITWTTEDRKHGGGNVYGQRLLKGGILSGRPFRINTTHVGVGRLADLQVSRDGSFRVVWEGLGPNGRGKGLRERRYDGKGHPLEDETPVSSPN